MIAVFDEEEDIDLDSLTIRKEPYKHPEDWWKESF
jgi:hypothetical protein